MEDSKMEDTSTENAKVSDSGYSNTCSNSQSQRSSGTSSASRNSCQSESSGYQDRNTYVFETSLEVLPKPISKRKEKELKKKKNKTAHVTLLAANTKNLWKSSESKKTDDAATVELIDATDPSNYNEFSKTKENGIDASLEDSSSPADEFSVVISINNGLVIHTTPSLVATLGYPKDFWIGKHFIDLFFPTDKEVFINKVAKEIDVSEKIHASGLICLKHECIVCRLQKYNNPENNETPEYLPFRIRILIKNFWEDDASNSRPQVMLLVASCQLVRSAFKAPEETIMPSVFTTRHTSTCHLSHVDTDVVQYFGYLPQDMIGRSLFDYYHPEDLPLIKDIYETVISLEGSSFRSRPYRFIIQNGDFVVLETEWSSFINPWTKRLEFVVGKHRVLKGPAHHDVFRTPDKQETSFLSSISEEVLKEAKVIEQEILELLNEGAKKRRPSSLPTQEFIKNKEFNSFVQNLLQEIKVHHHAKEDPAMDVKSFSEHDSVILGEISPHHEYYDSNSTETPPSYDYLNYSENIERFFKSSLGNPAPYGSDEEDSNKNETSGTDPKGLSSANESDDSRSTEHHHSTDSNTEGSKFEPLNLTEDLLLKHNEDMEKLLIQKHREKNHTNKKKDDKMKDTNTILCQDSSVVNQPHGVKRSGCQQAGQNNAKVAKYEEVAKNQKDVPDTNGHVNGVNKGKENVDTNIKFQSQIVRPVLGLPTSVPTCFGAHNIFSPFIPRYTVPPVVPVCYLPLSTHDTHLQSRDHLQLDNISQTNQTNQLIRNGSCFSYLPAPSLIYPPMMNTFATGPIIYRPSLFNEPSASTVPTKAQNSMPEMSPSHANTSSVKNESESFVSGCSKKNQNSDNEQYQCSCSSSFLSSALNKSSNSSCITDNRDNNYSRDISSDCHSKYQKPTRSEKENFANPQDNSSIQHQFKRKGAPWLKSVEMTPHLIYEYQLPETKVDEVLKSDMKMLEKYKQPVQVDTQLQQLYLNLEGFTKNLMMNDGPSVFESDSCLSNDTLNSSCKLGAW